MVTKAEPGSPARINGLPFHAVRDAVRVVRSARGETQEQAKEELGCSFREYTNWEYNRNLPSFMLTIDILKRELDTISTGVPIDLSLTLMGRMFSETFEMAPEKFRYTLGRLATLVGQASAPVDGGTAP